MKRFSFRLQMLLDMKKRREDELAIKVAEKNGEIILASRNLQESRDRLAKFQSDEKRDRGCGLDALRLRLSVVHRHALQQEIEGHGRRIIGLRQELQTAVQSLASARKETRMLENLRDKKRAQWKRDALREEQKLSDDVSQKGYIRRSKDPAASVR
jgi:flagellar export protein FliJ